MSSTNYPNALRFDLGAEQIAKLAEELIEESKKQLDQIVQIPKEQRTFANTMDAYNTYIAKFSVTSDICYFPSQVSTDKVIRDASTEATKKLEAFSIEVSTREDLYKAVVDYTEANASQLPKEGTEERKFIDDVIRDFKRDGLALPKEQREKVKQIKHRISELAIQFNKNNNEDQTKLLLKKEELAGLPEDYFEGRATEVKDGETYYVVTMKYPDYFPAIEQCQVDETRKKLDFAYGSRCIKENTPILEEVIQLRQEEANLLGYKSHAAYILEKRMAKTPEAVMNFLNDLNQKLDGPAHKELAVLLEMKRKHKEELGLPFDGKVNLWDWRFYDKMLLQKEYQIDEEKIKEYFPLDKVTTGLLSVYQDLLGLRFELMPKDKAHVWHVDVSQYEVFDSQTGNFVGHFYLDLHPRDGKYTHAAEFSLQKGCIVDGKRQYPAAAMVANFTKPTPTKPSLLTFNEVETYFHEFGHVMHEICTGAKYYYFAGTSVERDFVEAPSQMLENWVYEESVLAIISGHYQDHSKPLPDEYRQKLIKAKNVNEAFKNRRQLHFGLFDMQVHTISGKVDTQSLWAKNMKEVALTECQPGTNGAATFGHIVGGYSAGYYGYLWSKVYSCDMYSRFKQEGVLSKQLGRLYRDKILASGGTRDAMDYLVEFLGRPPSNEAFLVEIGAVQQ